MRPSFPCNDHAPGHNQAGRARVSPDGPHAARADAPQPCPPLPAGGQVNGGQATISSGANQTTISQTSPRVIIDWNGFNIGAGEKVLFSQPSAAAIAVNRIHDSGASTLDGALLANGNVWLINPNGILFGRNAQ
jgi:filamentous hemagglutinin family protein